VAVLPDELVRPQDPFRRAGVHGLADGLEDVEISLHAGLAEAPSTLMAGRVASREIARLSAGVSLKYFSPRMRRASALLAWIHAVAFRSARA
jgi:hypothetical protein